MRGSFYPVVVLLVLALPPVLAGRPAEPADFPDRGPQVYRIEECTPWRVVSEVEFCSDRYELACMRGDYSCLDLMRRTVLERTCKIYECGSGRGDDCYLVETRVERDSYLSHAGCCNICVMRSPPVASLGRVRPVLAALSRPCGARAERLVEGGGEDAG